MNKDLKAILLGVMKSKGINIPKFSKETGIPKDRVYKWYQQGTNPKPEDALLVEKWINDNADFLAVDDQKVIVGEVKQFIPDKDKQITTLQYENIQLRLNSLETNLNEVLSNQKVMMAMLSVAMSNAAEFYSGGNKAKAADLKDKMRTEIAAATK